VPVGATRSLPAADAQPLPPAEKRVPAFIPCHPKDLPTVSFCVDGLRRHPQVTSVTMIAPAELRPHSEALGVGFLDELSLLDPWFPSDEPMSDRRWYYQMFLKLSVAFMADGAPDRFLICDADTVLLHPFPLIDEESGTVLHPRMGEHVMPYYSGMRELLGHEIAYEGSHNAHFMVFRAPIIRAMFAEFARVQERRPDEGRAVLREFLQRCDRDKLSFADYETYGYYAREHFPDELRWVSRRQLNVLYVSPREPVLARLRPFYHYSSFHAYRRPDSIALRVAGSSWLALRLARDRLSGRPIEQPGDPAERAVSRAT
jgi:hypothetical protein